MTLRRAATGRSLRSVWNSTEKTAGCVLRMARTQTGPSMNAHGAILLAILALAAAAGAEALHATAPAWRTVSSVNWLPDRWTTPPICSGVELVIGCVPPGDVPAEQSETL